MPFEDAAEYKRLIPSHYCLWLDKSSDYSRRDGLRCRHFRRWFYRLGGNYESAGFESTKTLLEHHERIDQQIKDRRLHRSYCDSDEACVHAGYETLYPYLHPTLSRRKLCFRPQASTLGPNAYLKIQEPEDDFLLKALLEAASAGEESANEDDDVIMADVDMDKKRRHVIWEGDSDSEECSPEEEDASSEASSGEATSSNATSSEGDTDIPTIEKRGIKRKRDESDDEYESVEEEVLGAPPAKRARKMDELDQIFEPFNYSFLPVNDWRTVVGKCAPQQSRIDYSTLPSYDTPPTTPRGYCIHPAGTNCLCNADPATLFQRTKEWLAKSLHYKPSN